MKIEKVKRFFSTRYKTLLGKPHDLKAVFIETTRACPNVCYMCPSRKREEKFGTLSEANFRKAIDELSACNFNRQLHIYGQSEPLVDKKIFDRIHYARKKLPDAEIIMISNFVPLTEKNIDRLLDAPLTRLTTSVYSFDREAYKEITGRDNYAKAITNTIKFSKKWAKTQPYDFTINLINSTHNEHDKDFMTHFLEQIPCTETSVPGLWNLRGVLGKGKRKLYFDPWIYSLVKVSADGSLSFCVIDVDSKLLLGNIENNSLIESFTSRRAQKIRRDLFYLLGERGSDFCDDCDFANAHKIAYFLFPYSTKVKKQVNSFFNKEIFSEKNYGMVDYEIKKNTSEGLNNKLTNFNEIFKEESDWMEAISNMKEEFYLQQDTNEK